MENRTLFVSIAKESDCIWQIAQLLVMPQTPKGRKINSFLTGKRLRGVPKTFASLFVHKVFDLQSAQENIFRR